MEEIAIHLKPFSMELSDVKTRLRSLYRNGDKIGAPGFLDMRVEAEDKRYAELLDLQKQTSKDVSTILYRQAREDGKEAGEAEVERDRRVTDKGKRERVVMWVGIIGAIIALCVFITGVVSLILAAKVHTGEMEPIHISGSLSPQVAVESHQEYAGPRSPY